MNDQFYNLLSNYCRHVHIQNGKDNLASLLDQVIDEHVAPPEMRVSFSLTIR